MDPIAQFAEKTPNKIAISLEDRAFTYQQFDNDITSVSAWLITQGAEPEMTLGAFIPKNKYWEWVVFFACYRLGLKHVTFSNLYPQETKILGKVNFLISPIAEANSQLFEKQLAPYSPDFIRKEFPIEKAREVLSGINADNHDSFRKIMLTSGTTGTRKAVLWTKEIFQQRIQKICESNDFNENTKLCIVFRMDTTPGFRYPIATWLGGGEVTFSAGANNDIANVLVLPPSRLIKLIKSNAQWPVGKEQRSIIIAGGRLPEKARDQALARLCNQITTCYGSTETGSVAMGDATDLDKHPGSVGTIIDGANIQIVDENDKALPANQEGIVRSQTNYMVSGYLSAPAGSEKAFKDGWFYPGDRGYITDDNHLVITGRNNETINLGGVTISIVELENTLMEIPGISDLAAVKISLKSEDSIGLAVVLDAKQQQQAITQAIQAKTKGLSNIIFYVERIPRNGMGKIQRKLLEKELTMVLAKRSQARQSQH